MKILDMASTRGGKFFSEVELHNMLAMIVQGNVLHVGTASGRISSILHQKGSTLLA